MKIAAFVLLLAAAVPLQPLDSQIVIDRYATRLLHTESPKVLVFSYTVVQAGPRDIAETHEIYRSGDLVRDETLLVDGVKAKSIRIARYRNRYTLDDLAPRLSQYAFLFDGYHRSGASASYVYRAEELSPPGVFTVDGITIDAKSYLPRVVNFHIAQTGASGKGTVTFSRAGKYWVPAAVSIEASIAGKPARERITFSGYRFPRRLPRSTFQSPRPLPATKLPSF